MVAAITKWRTASHVRRSLPTDTLSVDLEAETSTGAGSEGGIARVDFAVVVNGGAPTITSVTARSLRQPSYAKKPSPLPGAPAGKQASFWGWGIVLDCAALPAGTIVVTATAYSTLGTATALPESTTLYNDADGTDRRPANKVIYVRPDGDDANSGTNPAAPRRSLAKAPQAACANPAGSSSADRDTSGSKVVMMAGAGPHQWALGTFGGIDDWHTTAEPLVVEFEEGAQIVAMAGEPDFYLIPRGFAGGGNCRLQFVGGLWPGCGGVIYVPSGVTCEVWLDGCIGGSAHWNATTKPYSVRFAEDNAEFVTFQGPGVGIRHADCCTKRGCLTAFHGWTSVQDCLVENWIGVALQEVGAEVGGALNVLCRGNRYTTGVAGWADVTGGAALSVSTAGLPAGQMRIDATAPMAMDFAAGFAEIAGTSYWGCQCGNFAAGNNGTFPVLSTGTNGSGFPYVVLANPSAVAGVGLAGAYLVTARISNGSRWIDAVHGDVLQFNTDRTGCVYSHIRAEDATNVQVVATNGHNLTRCAFIEWGDAAAPGQRWNVTETSLADCLFLHCTSAQSWDFTGAPETFVGTQVVECVIGASSGFPAGVAVDCHFVTGSTSGTGATSGAWFDGTPSVAPWSLLPAVGNLGSATGVAPYPTAWRWTGAIGDTRGCSRAVGIGDWSVASSSPVVAEGALASLGLTPLEGAARVGRVGQGALAAQTLTAVGGEARVGRVGGGTLVSIALTPLQGSAGGGVVAGGELAHMTWSPCFGQAIVRPRVTSLPMPGAPNNRHRRNPKPRLSEVPRSRARLQARGDRDKPWLRRGRR